MQVSAEQTVAALAALRRHRRRRARPRAGLRTRPARGVSPLVLDRAMARVAAQPVVRAGRVRAARVRLRTGVEPSAEAVADALLRRAICDSLS